MGLAAAGGGGDAAGAAAAGAGFGAGPAQAESSAVVAKETIRREFGFMSDFSFDSAEKLPGHRAPRPKRGGKWIGCSPGEELQRFLPQSAGCSSHISWVAFGMTTRVVIPNA